MESQPPQSSTPPPPPSAVPPPPPPGEAGASNVAAAPAAPLPNIDITICPVCKEPRAEDARFCEECGHDYGGPAPTPVQERGALSGPVLWVFLLFWVVIAIAGLFFLYNALWAI